MEAKNWKLNDTNYGYSASKFDWKITSCSEDTNKMQTESPCGRLFPQNGMQTPVV